VSIGLRLILLVIHSLRTKGQELSYWKSTKPQNTVKKKEKEKIKKKRLGAEVMWRIEMLWTLSRPPHVKLCMLHGIGRL
jgi:hypothetical protein